MGAPKLRIFTGFAHLRKMMTETKSYLIISIWKNEHPSNEQLSHFLFCICDLYCVNLEYWRWRCVIPVVVIQQVACKHFDLTLFQRCCMFNFIFVLSWYFGIFIDLYVCWGSTWLEIGIKIAFLSWSVAIKSVSLSGRKMISVTCILRLIIVSIWNWWREETDSTISIMSLVKL